jgi:hypothetical protein
MAIAIGVAPTDHLALPTTTAVADAVASTDRCTLKSSFDGKQSSETTQCDHRG